MKGIIIGFVVAISLIATFVIVSSVSINASVKEEMNNALTNGIESTQRVVYDKRKEIRSNDEYIKEFNENFKRQLNKDSEISYTVEVFGADHKKGIIDINVVGEYENLIGQKRQVQERRTMILDIVEKK